MTQRDLSLKLKRAINHCHYVENGSRPLTVCEFIEWCEKCGAVPEEVLRKMRGR